MSFAIGRFIMVIDRINRWKGGPGQLDCLFLCGLRLIVGRLGLRFFVFDVGSNLFFGDPVSHLLYINTLI